MDPEEIEIDAIPDDEPLDVEIETVTAPTGPKASAEQQDAAWADSLSALDRARITARGLLPGASEPHRAQALMLLRRHVDTAMGQETRATPIVGRDERPTAGTTGLAQGATLGWADELGGAVRAQAGEGSYQQERDRLRTQARSAREQAPGMTALGEAAGTLPYMLIPGAGSTGAARIAVQGGIGAGLGTASGAGFSEGATAQDVATDAVMGGLVGGTLGAGGQTLAEGARAGMGALARYGATADRARVAAVAPGRGGQIEERIISEARRLPGGVEGAAESLRRQGITGALSSADDVVRQAQAARERLDSEVLSPMYDRLDEIAPVSRERLLSRLDQLANDFDRDPQPGADRLSRYLQRMTDRMRGSTHAPPRGQEGPSGPPRVPETLRYREARDLIEPIRQAAQLSGPESRAVVQRASRDAYRAAREALDEIAGDAIASADPGAGGGYRDAAGSREAADEAIAAFQRARRDRVIAGFAEQHAQDTGARQATRGMLGLRDHLFAQQGGGGGFGYAARAVGHRLLNSAETGMRATGAEMAERLVRQHPERLGRWAGPLMRALEQGGAAFAAAHMSLSARDPEYRRAVEQASEEATEEQE